MLRQAQGFPDSRTTLEEGYCLLTKIISDLYNMLLTITRKNPRQPEVSNMETQQESHLNKSQVLLTSSVSP